MFINELKRKGIYQETALSKQYGRPPGTDPQAYSEMFEQIEKALGKYGAKRGQKFNELCYQSLSTIDSELATLYKQIEELPIGKAREAVQKKAIKIIESRHRDMEYLDIKIMEGIQARLGLKTIPLEKENVLQPISSALAEIKKTILEEKIPCDIEGNIEGIKQIQKDIAKSGLRADVKQKLIDSYNSIIDYIEKHGTIEGFELLG